MIEFIGRLHPLLVHLPIGFLVLLGIFEALTLRPRWEPLAAASRLISGLTFPASLAAIVCGWLLAGAGNDYDSRLLWWHRWLGTGVGVASLLLIGLRRLGLLRVYRWTLAVTVALMAAASHFGGALTHGSDFLSWQREKSSSLAAAASGDIAKDPVYPAVIQPIFNRYCVNCHGAEKAKAGLRLNTAENLLKGGDSGSAIEPPGATQSLLGKLISLPKDEDEHMPPAGKRQLSANELALLRWWLDAGAPTDKTVKELDPPAEILQILKLPPVPPASRQADNNPPNPHP
jgi:uncharacterized membrane protein